MSLWAMSLSVVSLAADPMTDLEQARAHLANGQIALAETLLVPLAQRDDQIGRVATFGLANARVLHAEQSGQSIQQRRENLLVAIRLYRSLLSRGGRGLPLPDDIAHNMLVAKAALLGLPASPETTSPTTADSETDPETVTSPERDPTSPTPSDRHDTNPAEASTGADVIQPTPGIQDSDPGPLSPDQAKAKIREALKRLKESRPIDARPVSHRRAINDY